MAFVINNTGGNHQSVRERGRKEWRASAKSESKGGLYNSELTTPTTVVNLSCGGILLLLL